jgi:hypothetical protein
MFQLFVYAQQRDATHLPLMSLRPRAWRAVRLQHGLFSPDLVFAPTLITATPPASLATRSCSFSVVSLHASHLDTHLFDTRFNVSSCGAINDDGVFLC